MENYLEDGPTEQPEAPVKREKKTTTLSMGKMRVKLAEEASLIEENGKFMTWLTSHRVFLDEDDVDKAAYSVLHNMMEQPRKTFRNAKEFNEWYQIARPRRRGNSILWSGPPEDVEVVPEELVDRN